ncbi:hypothetical protein V1264_021950 [Littorina saxatilis]|uniref:Uncharacterized protein n=1 Tax=Littorina saxatilis TaxID=31220 RepID=A0AAN9FWU6_9CAEN
MATHFLFIQRHCTQKSTALKQLTYSEAKTLVKRHYQTTWNAQHSLPSDDQMPNLQRHQQTILFRLRTGHCRLRAHMHRLGLSHTPNCPCETGPQTPEHILQTCPLHQEARTDHWPQGATLQEQLWGTKDSLILTTSFIQATKLEV